MELKNYKNFIDKNNKIYEKSSNDDADFNELKDLISQFFERKNIDAEIDIDGEGIIIYFDVQTPISYDKLLEIFSILTEMDKKIFHDYESEIDTWESRNNKSVISIFYKF